MLINEAVKKALEMEAMIVRREWERTSDERMAIKPKNTRAVCWIVYLNTEDAPKRERRWWAPKADDLVADDWELL